jgi:hypothetical protein
MSLAHAFGQDLSLHCVSNCAPIVFVVDDDISVRESLCLLIRCEGWQAETFESAQEFLARPRPLVITGGDPFACPASPAAFSFRGSPPKDLAHAASPISVT